VFLNETISLGKLYFPVYDKSNNQSQLNDDDDDDDDNNNNNNKNMSY